MAFPTLQNRTVRMLIVAGATVGAVVTIAGGAAISYSQAKSNAIAGLEEKTAVWADAAGFVINNARARLSNLSQSTMSKSPREIGDYLRRLTFESPIFSSPIMLLDGTVRATALGEPDTGPAADTVFRDLGEPGDVRLVNLTTNGANPSGYAINFNAGDGRSFSVTVPPPGIAGLMRYGDRESDFDVYLTDEEGRIFDRSVNAPSDSPAILPPAPNGVQFDGPNMVLSKAIPGTAYFVTALLSRQALLRQWTANLPIYVILSLVLAICLVSAAFVASAKTHTLESELREACRLNQVVAHYQPVLNLQSGACVGVEVLMRWQHPARGLVPPALFIPEAERTGVITELTECLMVRAMNELEPLLKERPGFNVAINVPVQTLTNPAFPAHVDRIINRRFSYSQITFEVTESTSLNQSMVTQMHAMRDLGIRLAVDDFGTGYSNLRYLSIFPFDFLKIDKAFVDGISADSTSPGLVDQIITIGRACGLQLIAEGIETQIQADALRQRNVEFGQGFLYAAPMPLPRLREWLAEHEVSEESPRGAS